MKLTKLSVLVPCYNEENALHAIVDDGSRDRSGAVPRTGSTTAGGDIVLVQEADIEYSPATLPRYNLG